MAIPYTHYVESAAYLRQRLPEPPEIAVVLGSGLGRLADAVTGAVRIPYAEIPHFPRSTVASHAGVLIGGRLAGRPAAVLSGRFHYYEGYPMETVAYYVRVLHLLGVKTLLLTNAAGGVNPEYAVGDFMLLKDHIKFFSESPARGEVPSAFGERFFDMTETYASRLRAAARGVAARLGIRLHEGVYVYMPGPQFETPAEIRAIRLLGGDAVGMSTVPEAIAAAQCGMETLAVSCVTNMAAGMTPGVPVSDSEVTVAAANAADAFIALMEGIVAVV